MKHDETFYVESNKSIQRFMIVGVVLGVVLAIIPLCLPGGPVGRLNSDQNFWLTRCEFLFWTFIAVVSFALAGKQSLLINFTSGTLTYKYGTPATQREHFGMCADVSDLSLTTQQLSGGRSKYVLKMHWHKKGLPAMVLGIYFDSHEANGIMNNLAKRLGGVSCRQRKW